MIETPHPRLVGAVLAMGTALVLGSAARWISLRQATIETRRKRMASLATWWVLAAILGAATMTGVAGICCLLGLASGIAVWEFARMLGAAEEGADCRIGAGLVILVALGHYVAIVAGVPIEQLMRWQWGLMLILAVGYLLAGRTARITKHD